MTKVWQTLNNEASLNGVQFRGENENLSSRADVLPKTSNLVISPCHFADNGTERMHVQSMQSYCFCSLKMQIYDVLIAVAIIVAKAPYYCFFILFEFKTKVETYWLYFGRINEAEFVSSLTH